MKTAQKLLQKIIKCGNVHEIHRATNQVHKKSIMAKITPIKPYLYISTY